MEANTLHQTPFANTIWLAGSIFENAYLNADSGIQTPTRSIEFEGTQKCVGGNGAMAFME